MSAPAPSTLNVDAAVRRRYSQAAKAPEPSLCCPTSYPTALLAAIPEEVLERDYGCGDPTAHLRPGDTVLDLGSGAGKACFIAGQVVGPTGRVLGIDANDEMLGLARRHAPEVARRVGHDNVRFAKGSIQDLALDLQALERFLGEYPVRDAAGLARLETEMARLRLEEPLVASDSIDAVISNCVLNLVHPEQKRTLFHEIHRVLRPGGRAVISDIASDEDVPERLQADPELWSGCISGALREDRFLEAFEEAGFHGVTLLERAVRPWRTVEDIEFRSVTVVAWKGEGGPCLDQGHAVVYRGPFREVTDDEGHVLRRGVRTAVCERTFRTYSREPLQAHVDLVPPGALVPLDEAPPFPCSAEPIRRDPRVTKAGFAGATAAPAAPADANSEDRPGACASEPGAAGGCC